MKRLAKLTICLFLWAFMMSFAFSANATLDPARAASDAQSVSAEHRQFCEHARPDLSGDETRLCEYAKDIPDCPAYADACDKTKPKMPTLPKWLDSILTTIANALATIMKLLGPVGIWVVAGIVLGVVLYPVVQSIAQMRKQKIDSDRVALPGLPMKGDAELLKLSRDDDATRVLDEANLLAQQGQLDRALYRYLHAALISLDKNGSIVIARDKTHGEYVRGCRDVEAKPPLRDLIREIEIVRFGGREPSQGGVAIAQERATWIVRRALAAVVMVAAFFVAGCQPPQIGSGDAAGSDTLRGLLEKQNVEVKPLHSSLEKIPIPTAKDRETTPALYVDVDRIPLEDDTQEHLLRWVDAGGILVLAGTPSRWPKRLGAKIEPSTSRVVNVTTYTEETRKKAHSADDDETDDDDDGEETTLVPRVDVAKLSAPAAAQWVGKGTFVLASTGDEKDYVVGEMRGAGAIYAAASDDLFTNAGLAIPGNAAAAIAILSNVPRTKFLFAQAGSGYSSPTNPFAGLINAGLGLPLVHALFATIILFFAVGMRLAAPLPDAPPQRRAFTEHVFATAAIYGRTKSAKHALASFGRYAEPRLVKKLSRNAPDIVSFLSQRSGEPIEVCAVIWNRAMVAREAENDLPQGDELKILRTLTSIYSRAMQ